MGWIRCVRCEKFRHTFVARTFALIAPVHTVLHRVSCSYEMIPNVTKHYERLQNMSLGSNGVDRLCLLRKIPTRFHGTNFCINCPVRPILNRVLKDKETVPNALKQYKMHQNMSLESNGVDWVHSLRKNPTRLRGTNFCINCTNLAHSAPSFML